MIVTFFDVRDLVIWQPKTNEMVSYTIAAGANSTVTVPLPPTGCTRLVNVLQALMKYEGGYEGKIGGV